MSDAFDGDKHDTLRHIRNYIMQLLTLSDSDEPHFQLKPFCAWPEGEMEGFLLALQGEKEVVMVRITGYEPLRDQEEVDKMTTDAMASSIEIVKLPSPVMN